MINRREAVTILGGASLFCLTFPTAATGAGQDSAPGGIAKELERMGARVYSEEGIPMFLVCENVASQTVGSRQTVELTELNKIVSSALRRYASEWERIRPNASAADVQKIVEYLAHRDFAGGGKETSL